MSTPADTGANHPPTIDLTDPELAADPYAGFGRIREQGPVQRGRFVDGSPLWIVTRHDDVRSVLDDPRFANHSTSVPGIETNVRARILAKVGIPEKYIPYLAETILDDDPPDHTRLRKLVSRAFTVRRVNDLRPRVEAITRTLLDALPGHAEDGVVDLIENYAYPLPITVICELVGVPEEDRPLWRKWGRDIINQDPESMGTAVRDMVEHIRTMLARRRRAWPADDLLDALIRVRDEDDRLTEDELVTMVLTLVFAGHETTAHLIGNGTAALLTHPDQLALVRADPSLLPAAVHELMRWCGPVLGTRPRYATEDITIGDTLIHQGDTVQAILVGANRDPRAFDDPDRLDILRRPATRGEQHVGFGHGAHYCLGAALARQEGEVAFGMLLDRYPSLTLAVAEPDLAWMPHPMMRRLTRLPVRLSC